MGAVSLQPAGARSAAAAKASPRPVVRTVKLITRHLDGEDQRWVRIRARDPDATVISVELEYENGDRVIADGSCETVRRGRRRTDGRETRMDLPLAASATGERYVLNVRAYSIRCDRKKASRDQWGRFRAFELDLGTDEPTGSTGSAT
ncbi:MAG TPA: hypothetical protein VGO97_05145 [Solirubrobacterales bacterium]|nr:hypothetical protein [Solirubrobacterales bacterium]